MHCSLKAVAGQPCQNTGEMAYILGLPDSMGFVCWTIPQSHITNYNHSTF